MNSSLVGSQNRDTIKTYASVDHLIFSCVLGISLSNSSGSPSFFITSSAIHVCALRHAAYPFRIIERHVSKPTTSFCSNPFDINFHPFRLTIRKDMPLLSSVTFGSILDTNSSCFIHVSKVCNRALPWTPNSSCKSQPVTNKSVPCHLCVCTSVAGTWYKVNTSLYHVGISKVGTTLTFEPQSPSPN